MSMKTASGSSCEPGQVNHAIATNRRLQHAALGRWLPVKPTPGGYGMLIKQNGIGQVNRTSRGLHFLEVDDRGGVLREIYLQPALDALKASVAAFDVEAKRPLTILGPSDRRMVVGGLQDADSRQQLWWARVAEMATGEVPQVAKPVATDLPAPSPEPPPVLPEVQGCECTCEELASINAFLERMQNTKDPAALMSLSQSPMLEKHVPHELRCCVSRLRVIRAQAPSPRDSKWTRWRRQENANARLPGTGARRRL